MTETSYVWDGVVTGDAVLAPYAKTTFNKFSHLKILSDVSEGYVIPGYLKDLKVEYAGNYLMQVNVGAGAVVFNNYVYVLDTDISLSFESPTSGYRRPDVIAIRLDTNPSSSTFQTARAVVIKGTEQLVGTRLTLPSLTTTALTYEIALAVVYLENPNSYNYILDGNIHDTRRFAITDKSRELYNGKYNLIRNSEFMAFSGYGSFLDYPEYWWAGGFTSLDVTSFGIPMTRGLAVQARGGTLAQFIPVNKNIKTFTLRGLLKLDVGSTSDTQGIIQVWGFRKTGEITKKHIRRMVTYYYNDVDSYFDIGHNYEFQETITFDEDDIDYLEVSVVCTAIVLIGQFILVPGYHPGPFRPFNEVIPFRKALTDTSWDGDAKSTGTTTITLNASFGSIISDQTKALILRLRARDSGSAANVTNLYVQGYVAPFNTIYGTLELGGVTNDVWREMQVVVPIHQRKFSTANTSLSRQPQFRIGVTASGAGTLDAVVEIVGIIT